MVLDLVFLSRTKNVAEQQEVLLLLPGLEDQLGCPIGLRRNMVRNDKYLAVWLE